MFHFSHVFPDVCVCWGCIHETLSAYLTVMELYVLNTLWILHLIYGKINLLIRVLYTLICAKHFVDDRSAHNGCRPKSLKHIYKRQQWQQKNFTGIKCFICRDFQSISTWTTTFTNMNKVLYGVQSKGIGFWVAWLWIGNHALDSRKNICPTNNSQD